MNEYSLYNPDSELAHHGILGMKWGVRRYQNPDGSLTALGRKRLGMVGSSRLLTALENADAVGVYKRGRRKAKSQAKIARSRAQSAAKKADKMQTSDDSAKIFELKQKSIREENEAKAWDEVVRSYDQKIKDIKSGDVRAGRDFLIQYDADFTLPVAAFLTGAAAGFPLPLLTPIETTIINVPKENKR